MIDMPHALLQNKAEPQESLSVRYRSITLAGTADWCIFTRGFFTKEDSVLAVSLTVL